MSARVKQTAVRHRRIRGLRRIVATGATCLLGALQTSCHFFGEPTRCEDVSYKTGERYEVTVLELLPAEFRSDEGPNCTPLAIGDKFLIVVGEAPENPEKDCSHTADPEFVPEFIKATGLSCGRGPELGLDCQSETVGARFELIVEARAGATVEGLLVVVWSAADGGCQKRFKVAVTDAALLDAGEGG
jgi:hypothetical protein